MAIHGCTGSPCPVCHPDQVPLPLAEFVIPEPDPTLSHAEKYERWIALNGWVLDVVERLADDYRKRGAKRLGMKHLVEIVRYEHGRATQGDVFRVNNNHTAYLCRDLLARRPDLTELFEVRRQQDEAA